MQKIPKLWVAVGIVLITANSSQAEFGKVFMNLTHDGGSSAPIVVGQAGGIVPIEISFSATISGTSGSNRGVGGVAFRLETGLPLIDQIPVTLSPQFTNPANAAGSTTAGAGFGTYPDSGALVDSNSDGAKDAIDAAGGFQAAPSNPQFTIGPNGNPGPDLEFAGIFAPIQIATSGILVAPNTPEGTYVLEVFLLAGALWNHNPGVILAIRADISSSMDTLNLIVVPEPVTLLLLLPGGIAVLRDRSPRRGRRMRGRGIDQSR